MTNEQRRHTCAECGARLEADAAACDLCGAPVVSPVLPDVPAEAAAGILAAEGTFCNQCGWRNPAGARFCSRCGTPLQDLADTGSLASGPRPVPVAASLPTSGATPRPAAAVPPAPDDQGAMTRQVGIVVGAGVLLVVALFLVTALSKDVPAAPPVPGEVAATPTTAGALPPIAPEFAADVAALEAEAAEAEGDARTAKQRELVNLLIGIGRMDRAALVQEDIARAEDTAEAWARTGNLYYDWAESVEADAQRVTPARGAVAAYERALELEPDNLDVRTDMAWVSQYDPERPMESVVQTNLVLEQDPDHVAANFNKGLLFLRINRLDQALAQFEKVQTLVDRGSPIHGQAEAAAQTVRERMQAGI